ncbi:MAG: hypothetical protein ABI373_04635, partial [Flavobacteriales bacterium]
MAARATGTLRSLLILAVAGLAACTSQPKMPETSNVPKVPAFDLAGMDTTVKPCDDFDEFANGNWKKNNPVPATESRWGAFGILAKENIEVKVKGIIDSLLTVQNPKKGSDAQLISDFYRSYMDTVMLEKLGATPLMPWMNKIDALKDL